MIKLFDFVSAFCAINLFLWLFLGVQIVTITLTDQGIADLRTFTSYIVQFAVVWVQMLRQMTGQKKPFDWIAKK